jgi:nucleoid-associated protein YgaU
MPLPTQNSEVARSAADVMRETQPGGTGRNDKPVQAQAQTYVVKSGDNLGKIAQRFYGNIIGNKLATINTLFNANRAVLKSQDDVPAGVKLTIPLITGAATQLVNTGKSNQRTQRPKRTTLEYTVKDGDSLWEIAEARLGNGSRYKEIADLNQTVLQGGVKVVPGMRLKLPQQ